MPHMAYGETETAKELAKHNMQILLKEDFDAIICDCASCSSTFKECIRISLRKELRNTIRLNNWQPRRGISVNSSWLKPASNRQQRQKVRVTYHDPCHLKRAQKSLKMPREVLKSIPVSSLWKCQIRTVAVVRQAASRLCTMIYR